MIHEEHLRDAFRLDGQRLGEEVHQQLRVELLGTGPRLLVVDALGVAAFSYHVVERPFLRLKDGLRGDGRPGRPGRSGRPDPAPRLPEEATR